MNALSTRRLGYRIDYSIYDRIYYSIFDRCRYRIYSRIGTLP